MEKVIEFLNKQGCKCESLQLFSVKYSPSLNTLNVVFSSPEEYSAQEVSKMQLQLDKFVENRCTVQVKVKKQIVSADSCEFVVKKLLNENALYTTIFNAESVEASLKDDLSVTLKLKVDKAGFGDDEKAKFEFDCEQRLRLLGIKAVDYIYQNYTIDYEQILSSRKEAFDDENVEEP